ncbi:MAG: hypothetical protein JXL97_11465 [Bacteroidales bacterium]|nr:hypothetical protein [Bacteroidales bacterium]
METTLNQMKLLEKYLDKNQSNIDDVFANSVMKLFHREINKNNDLVEKLKNQLESFESTYKIDSDKFYIQYNNGELGDEINFVEWASTYEMFENAKKNLEILQNLSV